MSPGGRTALLFVLFAAVSAAARAEPALPGLFSDHMVLQRGAEIRVWGRAEAAERISVSLAGDSRGTAADGGGHWSVSLSSRAAGGPFVLEIRGAGTIRIKDVMVGEVWVASGQSNMTFPLEDSQDAARELARADLPGVRFFTVPKKTLLSPASGTGPAAWTSCSPETAAKFSAAGYYFARKLHESLGVPVGVVLSSWPGTSIEEWMDPETLRRDPRFRTVVDHWDSSAPETKAFAREPALIDLRYDGFELLSFDGAVSTGFPGGLWSYSWADAPETAFETSQPGRSGAATAARVSGALDLASSSRLDARFRPDSEPADLSAYSGIRFWVRGHGSFRLQTIQPTISDQANYETSVYQGEADWRPITVRFADLRQEDWGVQRSLTPQAVTGFRLINMASVAAQSRPPSGLYDGMIAPLTPYRIRGALWYQGESDADRPGQYRALLPALIGGWRKAWGQGDFPFLIVQLPNIGSREDENEPMWAEMRDAQLSAARGLPNVGLAVAVDVGEAANVHPVRKREIGERLALQALGAVYGRDVVDSGPLEASARIDGGVVRVSFARAGSGLRPSDDGLKGFYIAGTDRKFHPAAARVRGDEVEVSSPEVPAPAAVRYDWADNPDGNLTNAEGLPASPFRTDDWPLGGGPPFETGH